MDKDENHPYKQVSSKAMTAAPNIKNILKLKQLLILLIVLTYFKGYSQQPIFVNTGFGLYSLDLNNCSSRYIGYAGLGSGDIAFTPNGQLWGIGENGDLYKIDTSNGTSFFIGKTGFKGVSLEGLNDSTLLLEFDKKLYGIRNKDATNYYIDSIGYSASGDLTWYDNTLYMTAGSKLVKILLNSSNSAILSVSLIKNTIPNCFGATNVDFSDSFNSIVGFSAGLAVYKICPIDGAYFQICPNIVKYGFDGGASIRLPVQQPEPTKCQLTNRIDKINSKKSKIEIFPNPIRKSGQFQIKLKDISFPYVISIINAQGVTLFSQSEQTDKEIFFDFGKLCLTSGFYIVTITSESNNLYSRIIVD